MVETIGKSDFNVATSPRSTKICSSRVKPIDSEALASIGWFSTLHASIELTTPTLFEGEKTI